MRVALALLGSGLTLLAGDPPKLPESLLKERWKALAIHQMNYVRSLEMQAVLVQSKAQYEKAVADLKAACGDNFRLDESGPEVTCVPVPRPHKEK